jgi:hypothetical protein
VQELERLVDDEMSKVRVNLQQDTVVSKREEEAVQFIRATAQKYARAKTWPGLSARVQGWARS